MQFLYILMALLIFGFLIFFHELGHFAVARLCGVKILEFAIGMGPKIFSVKSKKSGTVYSFRAFPIGGFVSMYGENGMELAQGDNGTGNSDGNSSFHEDDPSFFLQSTETKPTESKPVDPELAKQAYSNQSVWKRILISVAGPFMNVVLGFILMMVMVGGLGIDSLGTTVVAGYQEGNVSHESGLMPGDEIVKVGKTPVHTAYQLNYEIMNQGYRPIALTVKRNGEKIRLENVTFPQVSQEGVAFGELDFLILREAEMNLGTLVKHSWWQSCSAVKMVYDSLGGLIGGRYGVESVSGPVGITETITEAAQTDDGYAFYNVLHLIIVITINLGIMNLLPLPALDGGHLLLYVIEVIRRKPLPEKTEGVINFIGLIVLLTLAVIVAIKDIIAL